MKIEEVIENLEIAVKTYHESGDTWNENDDEMDESFKIAKECIEKQIAKKPERLNAFKSIGKCRWCEKVISARTASAYCQYCGNKVDWGNEE